MNRDLEKTLDELGPEYRRLVERLKAADSPVRRPARRFAAPYLAAASLAFLLALGILFLRPAAPVGEVTAARTLPAHSEFMLAHLRGEAAFAEILRTQGADGGWGNDFLTRQNAGALRSRTDPASRIAYKRAMRNLRLRGRL